jgi:hypothetical protein
MSINANGMFHRHNCVNGSQHSDGSSVGSTSRSNHVIFSSPKKSIQSVVIATSSKIANKVQNSEISSDGVVDENISPLNMLPGHSCVGINGKGNKPENSTGGNNGKGSYEKGNKPGNSNGGNNRKGNKPSIFAKKMKAWGQRVNLTRVIDN